MSDSSERVSPQHVVLANLFDDDRYDSIAEFAERQISLWVSIREGAYRRERSTLEIHCQQIRILTQTVFQTVRALAPASEGRPA